MESNYIEKNLNSSSEFMLSTKYPLFGGSTRLLHTMANAEHTALSLYRHSHNANSRDTAKDVEYESVQLECNPAYGTANIYEEIK